LGQAELRAVAEIVHEVEFKADDTVFSAGDDGDSLYIVLRGMVEVISTGGRTVAVLDASESVGEMALLDDEVRSASVVCKEDSVLLKITRDDFNQLILERPEIAFGLFKTLVGRLRSAIGGKRAIPLSA
ncbi:MAG: cyclic nucleotide-binding domain-containing protein, partial [Candidatus Lindowbacteria bacterium]|nr:cyclic nucleotide-binding domain-containing protein [Candidatus Lindowbacteria bacterium]